MKNETGKLKRTSKGYLLTLATKKGSADFQIPASAQCFRTEDAQDGLEVSVVRDDQNRIVKVTIPGKSEIAPVAAVAPPNRQGQSLRPGQRPGGNQYRDQGQRGGFAQSQPAALRKLPKANASSLGMPFHNPYTFLPFKEGVAKRHFITPHTVDETFIDDRLTGVLELEIKTESPLLSCGPIPTSTASNGHKTYEALTIGADVVLPATGVRGALRTLMTVLTGGTLGYLDEHAFLCQGRDKNLGPRGPFSPPDTPVAPIIAEVESPGNMFRSGTVRLGQTKLVNLKDLEQVYRKGPLPRGVRSQALWVGLDSDGRVRDISDQSSSKTPWKLKLSGRPVNLRGKREGVFLAGNSTLTLSPQFWADYMGRNVHGDRPELKKGDLIWIEPSDPELREVKDEKDVAGIHWARWSRKGESLKAHIKKNFPFVMPEYLAENNQKDVVDEVTDLFGQVSPKSDRQVTNFAGRIRPENLVFFDAIAKLQRNVHLAPLAPPHPGCIAFYRDNADPDDISDGDQLRGYKVYRTTRESGKVAPWLFTTQGVYDKQGRLQTPQQAVNKTVDLLPAGLTGRLRIAFRALSKRELAILIQACQVSWRLGGGKSLGLGWCSVKLARLVGEDGLDMEVPGWKLNQEHGLCTVTGWQETVTDIAPRVRMWEASQTPVAKLRYPRAVDANNFGKSRGGHTWFQRHALPRMTTNRDGSRENGLQPMHVAGKLKQRLLSEGAAIDNQNPLVAGQPLPPFNPDNPAADALFGHDAIGIHSESSDRSRQKVYIDLELFDEAQHISGQEKSEGNQGKNASFRKQNKDDRRK
jgi:hypothetical protein